MQALGNQRSLSSLQDHALATASIGVVAGIPWLPVEVEIEKEIGSTNKQDIEKIWDSRI